MVKIVRDIPEPGYKFTELEVFEHEVKAFESRGWKKAKSGTTAPSETPPTEETVTETSKDEDTTAPSETVTEGKGARKNKHTGE